MKKITAVILFLVMVVCFSACQNAADNDSSNTNVEYIYLPKTELRTRKNSGGFYREYKTVCKYDEKGNVIKKTEYTRGFLGIFNVRERQYDIEYIYNENGQIDSEHITTEDFCTSVTDGHQIYEDTNTYLYNDSGQLIEKKQSGGFDLKYEYDDNGNLVKQIERYPDDSNTSDNEYIFYYDSQNVLTKKQYKTAFLSSIHLDSEMEYTYNSDGILIKMKTTYYEKTGEESDYSETKYTYDDLNRLVKEEYTNYSLDGEIRTEDIREYKDFIRVEVKLN